MAPNLRKRRRRRGEYWQLYWAEHGRRRSESLGPVAEISPAQARIALRAKEIELGRSRPAAAPTLATWVETYLAWHAREYPSSTSRVAQICTQWLVPVFGGYPLDELRKADLEAYKLTRDAAPATVAKEMRTLQAVLNKAVEWEVIPRNPIKGVKPPQDLDDAPPRYYRRDELRGLYEVSGARGNWWKLLANTGLRRGEALNLRWEDIDETVLRVVSSGGSRTKSGRSRAVPLNHAAAQALEGISECGSFVFPRMVPRSLSRNFEADAMRAGIGGSIHCLRHTFCAQLVLAGVHARAVQQLAGHSTIRVTERYTKLLGSELAAEVGRLNL